MASVNLDAEELRHRISPLFQANFNHFGELGAAISVWQNGKAVLELHGGFRDAARKEPWGADTLVLVWSATKGIGSACLLHALQEHGIGLDRAVVEFWPEFAQGSKSGITLAQLLSHSAGLCALEEKVAVTDYPAVIRALQNQVPLWPPGTGHGYHARTFGFLIDELMRRLTSTSIAHYWRKVFAEPLGLDFWIGLPEELNARCATVYAAKTGKPPQPPEFYRNLTAPGTLQQRTFTSPYGLQSVSGMNKPENRRLDIVSFGGIGSATALAKFYALLANGGALDGTQFFQQATIAMMTKTLANGVDRVFGIPTAFSAGLLKDSPSGKRRIFGPASAAFGHPGAGGSHAFADPQNNIAFAYVMNQLEQTLFPNEKSLRMIDAIYRI